MSWTTLRAPDKRIIHLHADWLRRTGATERTVFHRRENLRRLAERLPCPLLDATPALLDDWQSALTVCTASIATYTNHVCGFFRWALDNEHVTADPSTRLPRPKVPTGVARPIPERDIRVALGCATEPLRTWLLLATFMGLRAMEIAQIRHEDLTETGGRLLLAGVGKGTRAYRLPVPLTIEPDIRAHMQRQRGPLWLTEHGRPLTAGYVTNAASRFFRTIGMTYTLHQARHTFGTTFYRATRDLLLTQDVMRHRSPNSTRRYVETTRDEATAAMDQLAAGLCDVPAPL